MVDKRCGGVERLSSHEAAELSRLDHRLLSMKCDIYDDDAMMIAIMLMVMTMMTMIAIMMTMITMTTTMMLMTITKQRHLLLRHDLIVPTAAASLHPPQRRPP